MKSLIIGIIILAAAVFAVLSPDLAGFGLGWWKDVLAFLRGGLPVIAVLIGIADIKDRAEARKEEQNSAEETNKKE
jgi:hypothetical protein